MVDHQEPENPSPDPSSSVSSEEEKTPQEASAPLSPTEELLHRSQQLEKTKEELEYKLVDMEKRLMEEREKVLLASLKSKEESAISAKVETSLQEVQDRKRRDIRENDLDKARVAAEARAAEMEKQLQEEHKSWRSVLEQHLQQKNIELEKIEQIFSARILETEKRWGQEKEQFNESLKRMEMELQEAEQKHSLEIGKLSFQNKKYKEKRDQGWKEICVELEGLVFEMEKHFRQRQDLEKSLAFKEQEIQRAQGDIQGLQSKVLTLEENKRILQTYFSEEITSLSAELKNAQTSSPLGERTSSGKVVPAPEMEKIKKELDTVYQERDGLKSSLATEQQEILKLRGELVQSMAHAETTVVRQKAAWEAERAVIQSEKDRYKSRTEELEKKLNSGSVIRSDEEKIRQELGSVISSEAAHSLKELENKVESLSHQNETFKRELDSAQNQVRRWTNSAAEEEQRRKNLEGQLQRVQGENSSREIFMRNELDREIRRAQEDWERERRRWNEEVNQDSQKRVKEQENKSRQEIENLRRHVDEDFSHLEKINRELQRDRDALHREKEFLQRSLNDAQRNISHAPLSASAPAPVGETSSAFQSMTALWENRIQQMEKRLAEENRMLIQRLYDMDKKLHNQEEEERRYEKMEEEFVHPHVKLNEDTAFYVRSESQRPQKMKPAQVSGGVAASVKKKESFLGKVNSWLDRAVIELRFDG